MKTLLIYPPITVLKLDINVPIKSALLGLCYIGPVLKNAGHEVSILDCLISSTYSHEIGS